MFSIAKECGVSSSIDNFWCSHPSRSTEDFEPLTSIVGGYDGVINVPFPVKVHGGYNPTNSVGSCCHMFLLVLRKEIVTILMEHWQAVVMVTLTRFITRVTPCLCHVRSRANLPLVEYASYSHRVVRFQVIQVSHFLRILCISELVDK